MEILLAKPRGFCAGVDRAISIVEQAISKYGRPIYVRHEIVHNKAVVSNLKKKGAIFVEELEEVPDGSVVIFSAHGVPTRVVTEASQRGLNAIDATCPLVKKVHSAVINHDKKDVRVILIGHRGHPEVEGTMGQLPKGKVILVGSVKEANSLELDAEKLAYTTQTTLSIDETKDIIDALKSRYPHILGPDQGDLCYATTNRQKAVRELIGEVDMILVIGSSNSSNSNRLREIGSENKKPSYLIDGPQDINPEWFKNCSVIGISSGASAPEDLVQDVIKWIKSHFPGSHAREFVIMEENVHFPIPKELRSA